MAKRSVEQINQVLEEIREQIKATPRLAKAISYYIKPKNQNDNWEGVLNYQGPDEETVALLQDKREQWTQDPGLFVNMMEVIPQMNHPVVHAAFHCRRLSKVAPWAEMLRRCFCMWLSQLQKHYHLDPDEVAAQIRYLDPQSDVEGKDISQLQDAGSRYEALEISLGVGVTFVLGVQQSRRVWERNIPKSGEEHKKAVQHLQSTGITEMAGQNIALRDAVFRYYLWHLWHLWQAPQPVPQISAVLSAVGYNPHSDYPASLDMTDGDFCEQGLSVYVPV